MNKVDLAFVRRMTRQATEACIRDFAEIQKGLPVCLQRPRRLSAERCRELKEILDEHEERQKRAFRMVH